METVPRIQGSPVYEAIRSWLSGQVERGTPLVRNFQDFFGVGKKRAFLNISAASRPHSAQTTTKTQKNESSSNDDTALKSTATVESTKNEVNKEDDEVAGPFLSLLYFVSEIYFRFASVFGEEVTFVVMLPFLWWHFSAELSQNVVFLWCFTCYIGHVGKDLFQLPRPPASHVTHLEHHHAHEYGLPVCNSLPSRVSISIPLYCRLMDIFFLLFLLQSTHAISATTMPLTVVAYCIKYDLMSHFIVIALGIVWFASVSMSRLYLGVHSPADLFWGCLIGTAPILLKKQKKRRSSIVYFLLLLSLSSCYILWCATLSILSVRVPLSFLSKIPSLWPQESARLWCGNMFHILYLIGWNKSPLRWWSAFLSCSWDYYQSTLRHPNGQAPLAIQQQS